MEKIQHLLGFPELWWGEIIVVVVVVAIAFVLSRVFRNAGSLAFFIAAWLLYFLFRGKTVPHESWLIDLQWPWPVIVLGIIAIWFLIRRDYPVAAGLLMAFLLYTSLFLPMTWLYDHIWGWLGALISWLIPIVFWVALVIGMIGTVVYNHSDTVKGAGAATGGRNVAQVVVVFMLLFTLLGPVLNWASKGVDSWWHDGYKDNPSASIGPQPSRTAVPRSSTGSPSSQPTADENTLSPETLAALQDMADDESFKCTAYGVELEEKRLPSPSGNEVDQDLVVFRPGFTQSRQFTDAIQLPIQGDNAAEMLADVKRAICTDPLFGATVAATWARQPLLLQTGEWLTPLRVDDDAINAKVAELYLPYFGQGDLTPEQAVKRMEANVAYQGLANKLGSVLNNFVNAGVQQLSTDQTWHLPTSLPAVDGIPEVRRDSKVDHKSALVLEIRQKNDSCVLMRVGFNTADKRPEVFAVPSCSEQAKPKAKPRKSAASTPKPATTSSTSGTSTSSSQPKPDTSEACAQNAASDCPVNGGRDDPQDNDIDTGPSDPDGSPDPTSGSIVIPDS